MERKFIEHWDILAVTSSNPHHLTHMLKWADRSAFCDVFNYFRKSEFKVYLSGGVVSEWVFSGDRNYESVGLVCVPEHEKNKNGVLTQLESLSIPKLPIKYLRMGGHEFTVVDRNSTDKDKDELKYELINHRGTLSAILGRPSRFDLSIIDKMISHHLGMY